MFDSTILTSLLLSKSFVFTILYLYLVTFLKSNVNNRLKKFFLFLYSLLVYTYKYCSLRKSIAIFTVSLPIVYLTLVRGLYSILSVYILSLTIILPPTPLLPITFNTYV
nr:MAG TPA: hypothetical protein [Bacteriophage sp.]